MKDFYEVEYEQSIKENAKLQEQINRAVHKICTLENVIKAQREYIMYLEEQRELLENNKFIKEVTKEI